MSVCRIGNRDRDQDPILGCTSKESGDPKASDSRSSTNCRPRDSLNECVVARFAEVVQDGYDPEKKKHRPRRDKKKVQCETSEGAGSRSLSLNPGQEGV